jgi:hypothetical protein
MNQNYLDEHKSLWPAPAARRHAARFCLEVVAVNPTFALKPGAMAIVVTPHSAMAYVALRNSERVAIVDQKTLQMTGKIDGVGPVPDGMAWAERRKNEPVG